VTGCAPRDSGTLPWTVAHDRMTVFYKFCPHGVAHNGTFCSGQGGPAMK
jgi:hypothetical protein